MSLERKKGKRSVPKITLEVVKKTMLERAKILWLLGHSEFQGAPLPDWQTGKTDEWKPEPVIEIYKSEEMKKNKIHQFHNRWEGM